MIKKEYGKPKSVTKRTCKQYENGEKDECEKFITETPRAIPESPETIELNKKIELLSTPYSGIFKITFAKNNIVRDTQYVFAQDLDDVEVQIRQVLEDDLKDENIDYVINKIKNITRMTANAIKMDKACLKRLAEVSVEALEKTVENGKKLEEEILKRGNEKYQDLIQKGFKLYVGKLLPKRKIHFVELARDDNEANLLILAEDRTHKAMIAGQKIEGTQVGNVQDLAKEDEDYDGTEDKDLNIEIIKTVAKKEDSIYDVIFGDKTVDEYIKYIENAKMVMEKLKDGKANELIRDKINKMKEAIGDEGLVDNILAIDKQKRNLFGGNRTALRALLNK